MTSSPHREEGTVGFSLDTSGEVVGPIRDESGPAWVRRWSDLTPFQRGYVEAMFASAAADLTWQSSLTEGNDRGRKFGFSDLHPSALERIIGDCERRARSSGPVISREREVRLGARLWAERQAGQLAAFPPQRVSLSDAGQVGLEDA